MYPSTLVFCLDFVLEVSSKLCDKMEDQSLRLWIIQHDEPHSSIMWQSQILNTSLCLKCHIAELQLREAHTHFIDTSDIYVLDSSTLCYRCSLVPRSPGYKASSDVASFHGTQRSHWIEMCVYLVCIHLLSGSYMFCTVYNKTSSQLYHVDSSLVSMSCVCMVWAELLNCPPESNFQGYSFLDQ